MLTLSAGLTAANPVKLENIVDDVVVRHMTAKRIPGMSVAIVHNGKLVFSKGYGKASVEFGVPASPETVYPISSVSKMFAGLLALRLAESGELNLGASISKLLDDVPEDKNAITVRHLLQHTHGLVDYYFSDSYETETGKTVGDSPVAELVAWSLGKPLNFEPGSEWAYSLAGYVILARILEEAGGKPYETLVNQHVLAPLEISGTYGDSRVVVPGRNPVMYRLDGDKIVGHIVEFPQDSYAAGGLNLSVLEFAKLFIAISRGDVISSDAAQQLWFNPTLANGELANYGLGWFTYETSQKRWVVGHEGGGASWVIYYPDHDVAVIALSNMSGARADILPYEIARHALAAGLLRND